MDLLTPSLKSSPGHDMAEVSVSLTQAVWPFLFLSPRHHAVIYNLPGGFLLNPNKTVPKSEKQNDFPATFLELDELQLSYGRPSTSDVFWDLLNESSLHTWYTNEYSGHFVSGGLS